MNIHSAKIVFLLMLLHLLHIPDVMAIKMGSCGENVFWELSEEGTLIISGIGKMESQPHNGLVVRGVSRSPWAEETITKVVIREGITEIDSNAFASLLIKSVSIAPTVSIIGQCAFMNCKNLSSIDLPVGVIEIGDRAFEDCEKLSKISLPKSLQKIGYGSFAKCRKIKVLTIPKNLKFINACAFAGCTELITLNITDGVIGIRRNAFADCDNLTSVTLPGTLSFMENAVFENCSRLSNIYVSSTNQIFYEKDGVLFNKDELVLYPPSKQGDYIIPNGIKSIASNAFANSCCLTSITIPNGVTHIGHGAFARCYGLTSVILPNTLTEVGSSIFMNCDNLQQIYVSKIASKDIMNFDNLLEVRQLMVIDDNLFIGSDVDINIPDNTDKINNDRTYALIIANENYSTESDVPYALNDGKIFYEYCIKTLAIPKSNIRLRENATLGIIQQDLHWIQDITKIDGEAKIIFYYSGHGVPDEKDKTAWLLPIDGNARLVYTGIKIDELYASLGKYPASAVTIFLDACFSGYKRDGGLLDNTGRGVAVAVRRGQPNGNMVVFTAAQNDEVAYPFEDQQHGMFTYFLLKKLQETRGVVTYQELSNYVTDCVQKQSIIKNGINQTPCLLTSPTIQQQWQSWQFNINK